MPANLAIMYNKKLRKIIWEGEVFIINLTSSPSCNTESTNLSTGSVPKMENGINQIHSSAIFFHMESIQKFITKLHGHCPSLCV